MIDTEKFINWLGVTWLEIWMFSFFLLISLVLLVFKLDEIILSLTWYHVFLPLFISDTLACYFCLIIFIRQYINGYIKQALYRAFYSFFQLFLVFSFKVCLLYKLDGKKMVDNSDIFLYVSVLMIALLARLCIKH